MLPIAQCVNVQRRKISVEIAHLAPDAETGNYPDIQTKTKSENKNKNKNKNKRGQQLNPILRCYLFLAGS